MNASFFPEFGLYHRARFPVERRLVRASAIALLGVLTVIVPNLCRAQTCKEANDKLIVVERNTPVLRMEYRQALIPAEINPALPLVPFDGSGTAHPTGLIQLGEDGTLIFTTVQVDVQAAARDLATVPGCTHSACRLFSADLDRDGALDAAVVRESDGAIFRLLASSPNDLQPAGFVQETLIGFGEWPGDPSLHAISQEGSVLFARTVDAGGMVQHDRRRLMTFSGRQILGLVDLHAELRSVLLIGSNAPVFGELLVAPLPGGTPLKAAAEFQPGMFTWLKTLVATDLNGDGITDLFVLTTPSFEPWAAVGLRKGFFESPVHDIRKERMAFGHPVAAADFDGDGLGDVLFYEPIWKYWVAGFSRSAEPMRQAAVVAGSAALRTDGAGSLCAPPELFDRSAAVSVNGEPMTIVNRAERPGAPIRVLLRGTGRTGASVSVDSVPAGPFVCLGYHPDAETDLRSTTTFKWGSRYGSCPDDYGVYFTSEIGSQPTKIAGIDGPCCPLPYTGIVTGETVETFDRCPEGMIVTGERELFDTGPPREKAWLCRGISDRFVLGPETGGRYYGTGYSVRGHRERTRYDRIPPSIRPAAGRIWFNRWEDDGCVGAPPGSLLVGRSKEGLGCERMRFRELRFKGQTGDPPAGTAVPMYPDCQAIDNPYLTEGRCLVAPAPFPVLSPKQSAGE